MDHNTEAFKPTPNKIDANLRTSLLTTPGTGPAPTGWPLGAIGLGLLAGIVGVASMSLPQRPVQPLGKDEKSTAVPTEKIERILRKPEKFGSSGWLLNHAIHWGQGAFSKTLKPAFSHSRYQAIIPPFLFTGMRLSTDQILENLFRTGPQKNFTRNEKRIDLFQRAVYAFATGIFADLLIRSRNQPLTNR